METAPGVAGAKKKSATAAKAPSVQVKVSAPKKAKAAEKKQAGLKIKDKTGQKERIKHKMSKVEALHSTRKTSQPLVTSKKPGRKLAIQSPFRFPLDGERLAAQTARYGGLTLVTLGASLAIFYAQLVELPIAALTQLGAVCESNDLLCLMREQQQTLNQTTGTINTTTHEPIEEVQPATTETGTQPTTVTGGSATNQTLTLPAPPSTIQKHPAVFTVGSAEPLKGLVTVSVTVAEATSVNISAYYDLWNKTINLGSAKKENGAWVYSWNTVNFKNGRYKLKALIKNETGTYEQVAQRFLEIKNEAVTAVTEATPSAEAPGPLSIALNSAGTHVTLSQTYPEVTSSDVIRVYLEDEDEKSTFVDDAYLFTQAYLKTNVTWKQTFDISSFPSGAYIIRAERWRGEEHLDTSKATVSLPGANTYEQLPGPVPSESNATLSIRNANYLSGFADVTIESKDATFVELYAVNTASVNNLFIGLARKTGTGLWVFNWDTRQIPNSRYQLFARVGSSRGTYESNKIVVNVQNERASAPTTSQVEELSVRTEQYEELLTDNIVVRNNFWNVTTATTTAQALNDFIEENKERIQEEFQKLAAAIRSGNESAIATANTRLIGLENEFRDVVDGEENFEELVTAYNEYVDNARSRIETDVEKIERIIEERTNDGLFSDMDWDGVTDFDELYIYNTDPFLADTSGNGIPDGVKILNGLDPLSTDIDASIVFESPENIGIIRNDLLRVESVTAVEPDSDAPEVTTVAPAVIAGKALPNSFVTIFIFSTPVIVTVKTEADGSWQYRFEKELENGEHSVYVALTDNSGRIIARSSPLRFIKEAQAYSTIDEALASYGTEEAVENDYAFFSSSVVYLVMSFAVVTIGLVLLLLGIYIDRRRRQEPDMVAPVAATV